MLHYFTNPYLNQQEKKTARLYREREGKVLPTIATTTRPLLMLSLLLRVQLSVLLFIALFSTRCHAKLDRVGALTVGDESYLI